MAKPDVEFEVPAGSFLGLAINAGHKVLLHTIIPFPGNGWATEGKEYLWMQDTHGTIYLERVEQ